VKRHYSGPAEALLAVVENHVLTGRSAAERFVEADFDAAVDKLDTAADIRLPVTHLGCAIERGRRRRAQYPMRRPCAKSRAMQRGMVVALDDEQRISRQVLGGDEPRRIAGALQAAYAETAALTERVALESTMPAYDCAMLGFYRAGAPRKPVSDELAERALTDEADPGRVPLAGDRKPALARNFAYFGLPQSADREFAERQQ